MRWRWHRRTRWPLGSSFRPQHDPKNRRGMRLPCRKSARTERTKAERRARSNRHAGKALAKCVKVTAPFASQGCARHGRSTNGLPLLRCQSVTGTTPQCLVRYRQPQLQVLCWPFRLRSRRPRRPQRRYLSPRRHLLMQPLPPSPLLRPQCRRSLPNSRDSEFTTRAGATIIPTQGVTERVFRGTDIFGADTLASGKLGSRARWENNPVTSLTAGPVSL